MSEQLPEEAVNDKNPIKPDASFIARGEQADDLGIRIPIELGGTAAGAALEDISFELAENEDASDEHERSAQVEDKSLRDNAIQTILRKYQKDVRVARKVSEFKKQDKGSVFTDLHEARPYFNIAEQFSLLTESQIHDLFGGIEAGLLTYESLSDINNPSPEDEEALIDMVAAHDIIQLSNLKLVASLANHYLQYDMLPLSDLLQEGTIGLQKAIARFDHKRGYRFSTYAAFWIKDSIENILQSQSRLIKVPPRIHNKWIRLRRAISDLTNTLEREPTIEEIAESTGLTKEKIYFYEKVGRVRLTSLDVPVEYKDEPSEITIGDTLSDDNEFADTLDSQTSDRIEVEKMFASDRLSDKEKLVIGLRFALYHLLPDNLQVYDDQGQPVDYKEFIANITDKKKGLTLKGVSNLLGMDEDPTRYIEVKALGNARKILRTRGEG